MLKLILSSGRFPSPQHCNMYVNGKSGRHGEPKRRRRPSGGGAAGGAAPAAANQGGGDALALGLGAAAAAAAGQAAEAADDHEDLALAAATPIGPLGLYSNCPNACCTGAFVQETMSGIIMSADLHELIFTNETVGTAATNSGYKV